ncbi:MULTISPECIES: low temperature requirement protein A [unclassified Sphingomonas]|uniref:low temperature requirement protein A n=1 Tax=unclassified Sphingomonas TaxID=196159 RepID=UPI0006F243E0|nr:MULTISPECIES: low temperature requirement protein A [unclassified Sphingomonas]KQX25481.1 low temperature requirement protein A [Sphingomonas sp. Root1294]KQY66473.1 low temperature requirement protein A [Sphingomonas sp. Root50]KRB90209.1 low temperature requirement protein A [Sphingomonas sp. Root720]
MSERKRAILPMRPRDPAEPHRAATPLELLFDLVTVIAIATAAEGLHHAIAEAHAGQGVLRFALAFFSIWWAWMNFTWFASAYDNDDVVFRLLTMVIMAGSLALAAGVDALFRSLDIDLVVGGYVVMRLAMALLWLRAAGADRARRTTNLRYAGGILVVQLYWVGLVAIGSPGSTAFVPLMLLGFLFELAVPAFAERSVTTPWHRHHIVERYGLLTLIVLGEILLGASLALQAAAREGFDARLVHVALAALAITFAMWWLYFCEEEQLQGSGLRRALLWGYGHLPIFAAGAAVGAGFAVLVDIVAGHAHVPLRTGDLAVAIPLALYMGGIWFVRDRFVLGGGAGLVLPLFALAILVLPFVFPALEAIAALAVLAAIVRAWAGHRRTARG